LFVCNENNWRVSRDRINRSERKPLEHVGVIQFFMRLSNLYPRVAYMIRCNIISEREAKNEFLLQINQYYR